MKSNNKVKKLCKKMFIKYWKPNVEFIKMLNKKKLTLATYQCFFKKKDKKPNNNKNTKDKENNFTVLKFLQLNNNKDIYMRIYKCKIMEHQ